MSARKWTSAVWCFGASLLWTYYVRLRRHSGLQWAFKNIWLNDVLLRACRGYRRTKPEMA